MNQLIYVDNAATTNVSKVVLEAMMPYFIQEYGNPSTLYSLGQRAKEALETARRQIATAIGADPMEVYFTASGSEADNWAIRGVMANAAKNGKKHIITSEYEHHAVLETVEALQKNGFSVTYLKPTPDGFITAEAVRDAIQEDTGLVTIMTANNEIGTINPIAEIGAVCRAAGVPFFTDAVQAVGHIEIDVRKQNIDLLSMSGHKIHAPKGVGALYIKKGIRVANLITGGQQERGKRAGTENVPYAIGLGAAITEAVAQMKEQNKRLTSMRDRIIDGLLAIPDTRLNGSHENRLSGNVNISFAGVEGESLLLWLDMKGICVSTGSACASNSLDPSHVLLSIGVPTEVAHGSLRISLGDGNKEEDVDYIIESVKEVVNKLRAMSPIYNMK